MAFSDFYSKENMLSVGGINKNFHEVEVSTIMHEQVSRNVLGDIQNVVSRLRPSKRTETEMVNSSLYEEEVLPYKCFRRSNGLCADSIPAHKTREDLVNKAPPLCTRTNVVDLLVRDRPNVESGADTIWTEEEFDSSLLGLNTSYQEWVEPTTIDNDEEMVDLNSDPEYDLDVYNYLRSIEKNHVAKWNYLRKQPDITPSMRSILVDWLVEVTEEYKLQTETLYLAVSCIDRFLSSMSVERGKLQLVGTAALFIACKYEEIHPPDASEFAFITDNAYSKRQVLRMERLLLKVLDFNISVPSSYLFVYKFSEMMASDENTKFLAMYLNELFMMSSGFLQFSPSRVGAASLALARLTLGHPGWPDDMVAMTGYTKDDLSNCLLSVHQSRVEAENCPQRAIQGKYKSLKYNKVADIPLANL